MVYQGDCLEVLKTFEADSIDAIVTDPPYFLTNDNGSGFMGKEWDSSSVKHAIVELVFKSMKIVLSTEEVGRVAEPVSIKRILTNSELEVSSNAPSVGKNLNARHHKINPDISSVHPHVITKAEALALCKELSPSLIKCLQSLPNNVVFAVDLSSIKPQSKNIAQIVASILQDDPVWLDQITSFSKMGNLVSERSLSEIQNGIGLGNLSINETIGLAENVESNAEVIRSNVTTLNLTEFQKIITRIISLPSVKDVIKQCTNVPNFIQILSEIFHYNWAKEALRVLKPGGHMLVFCGPRTYHRMASGVEDAGFEIRDQLQWLFGSGFPKSRNLGNGWGTALKPANEPILLARKPCSEKTVAANVIKHGTGGINIDASRIGTEIRINPPTGDSIDLNADSYNRDKELHKAWHEKQLPKQVLGRFPANLILDEEAAQMLDEQSGVLHGHGSKNKIGKGIWGLTDTNIPITQTGGETGGASRFFFQVKHDTKSECQHTFAENVRSHFKTILPIIANTAHSNAVVKPEELFVQNVSCATNQCDTCAILIAQDLVAIKNLVFNQKESQAYLDFTVNSKNSILLHNLAFIVDQWVSTDIIPTIQSLSILFGCALHVTDVNTKPENLEKNSVPTRFLYCAKTSKSERNAGCEGLKKEKSKRLMILLILATAELQVNPVRRLLIITQP
jgi:hypothetical protein